MTDLAHLFDAPESLALYRVKGELQEAVKALEAVAKTTCREWPDFMLERCNQPAEFVLWGKLFPPEALGPRCYDHAAKHAGHRALGDPSWAIIDLRPALRVLEAVKAAS